MKLYRYQSDVWSLYTDESEFLDNATPKVILNEYTVNRQTEKSYFIKVNYKVKRVSKTAKNTYAYDTKEKAMYNYKKRCKSNLGHCRRAVMLAELFYKNSKTLKLN